MQILNDECPTLPFLQASRRVQFNVPGLFRKFSLLPLQDLHTCGGYIEEGNIVLGNQKPKSFLLVLPLQGWMVQKRNTVHKTFCRRLVS
jgi:hypothetical protein